MMDSDRQTFLLHEIGERSFNTTEEVQEYFRQRAMKQKVSGRWIALVAILVGVTYLAFQDLITILVISMLIVVGVFFLLRRESREVAAMQLNDAEAAELLEKIQSLNHQD
jgi:hypothetical protein